MAESMSTPTTISARNPVCKLCGGSQESGYMIRILSTAGLSKVLYSKFYKTTDIKISEDDTRSAVLCRSGVTFVDKLMMDQLIRRAQSVDNKPSIWSKLRIFCKAMRSTFTVFASAVEASIKGYATRKLRCGWAINKRGRKAYTTFTLRQNAACANILFFIFWVDYALEGSTFSLSKCDFSRLFHTERSWHTYRFTVVFVSGRPDLSSDMLWCKSIFFDLFWSVKLFITVE